MPECCALPLTIQLAMYVYVRIVSTGAPVAKCFLPRMAFTGYEVHTIAAVPQAKYMV